MYRRFALEMLSINPDVADIKKVGHDLDPSIGSGLTDMFQNAKKLFLYWTSAKSRSMETERYGG